MYMKENAILFAKTHCQMREELPNLSFNFTQADGFELINCVCDSIFKYQPEVSMFLARKYNDGRTTDLVTILSTSIPNEEAPKKLLINIKIDLLSR